MEEPPKKDEQFDGVSDPRGTPSESVLWLSFDGKEVLSSHEFVQKVQRMAFQQGKQRDDEWVADFAATCFGGEALEWYVDLDEESQTSWRKLRARLIQRWHIKSGKTASDTVDLDPANIPTPAPAASPPYALYRTTSAKALLGLIQVQMEDIDRILGYLAIDPEGRCIVRTEAAMGLVVAQPQQVRPDAPCRIAIEGPEVTKRSIAQMPYLGLSLLKQLGRNPDFVPTKIPCQSQGSLPLIESPIPSGLCDQKGRADGVKPFATWYISPCSRDPPGPWRKRSSLETSNPATAVFAWILDSITSELTLAWLTEDGTLDDLVACVDKDKGDVKLHMHRLHDFRVLEGCGYYSLCETRVKLLFTPIQS